MSAARKNLPAPSGGDDLTELLRRRRDPSTPAAPPSPPDPGPGPAGPRRRGAMDRRSWYMPTATAEALTAAVEDLHFATRAPKHEILTALVDVALAHRDEIAARLASHT